MTIGEIEYTRFFTDQPLFSPVLSRVVFLVFCVMMPIVLMNLTVLFSSEFTCSLAENFILNESDLLGVCLAFVLLNSVIS